MAAWTLKQEACLIELAKTDMSYAEIAEEMNRKFGTNRKRSSIHKRKGLIKQGGRLPEEAIKRTNKTK